MVKATRTIKAIETEYKGYRFRSRLEARWAVFFDACGVKWEYEPEGFDLGDGLYYLPDFLLHDVWVRNHTPHDLWVEVKGQMTDEDARKIIKFANQRYDEQNGTFDFDNRILVVTNIPDNSGDVFDIAYDEPEPYLFNFHLIDGDYYGACPCISPQGHFALVGSNYTGNIDFEATEKAYQLARQARFEHGEQPKPVFNREAFGKPDAVTTAPIKQSEAPVVSFELNRFFEDKVVYMHNYGRLQSGDNTQSRQDYIAGGMLDAPGNFAAEISSLEKEFGATRIMEATNTLIGISSEFRCEILDAFWKHFIDSRRHEAVKNFTSMIRERLTKTTNTKDETQMEVFKPTDAPAQGSVPVITVADIEDINARADAIAKIFGVPKADAIRTVIKLKAEEINRDLTPLLEFLG